MHYAPTITAQPNTARESAEELEIYLSRGTLVRGEVYFPRRSQGQLHVCICAGLHQIWPASPDEDIRGEDGAVLFESGYEVADYPYRYLIRAWNDDDTFDHSAIVRFTLVPPADPAEGVVYWLKQISDKLGVPRLRL